MSKVSSTKKLSTRDLPAVAIDPLSTLGDAFDYVGGLGASVESYAQSSIEQLPTILQNKIGFQFGTIQKTHQILDDLIEGVDSTILLKWSP